MTVPPTARTILVSVVLLVGACASETGGSTVTSSGADEVTLPGPGVTLPPLGPDITIEVDGSRWVLPVAACLTDESDEELLRSALETSARAAEMVAGSIASGWPTTTTAPPDTAEKRWTELRAAGVQAVVLSELIGSRNELIDRWQAHGQSYTDNGRFPPMPHILDRIDEWDGVASAVLDALRAQCGGA